MELSPQSVRTTSFKTVKKGYDPDEVDAFKLDVAGVIEAAQNQATAMEARARAAVAKLQEVSHQVSAAPAPAAVQASHDDAETISRTLLLAQRTADTAVSEAKAEADSILGGARGEATAILESARSMAGRLLDEARVEARRSGEDERLKAENEVQALLARRDFLVSDVDHLEQYIAGQRERIRDAAVALHELVDRVPAGLGDMRRPLLSASADHTGTAAVIPGMVQPERVDDVSVRSADESADEPAVEPAVDASDDAGIDATPIEPAATALGEVADDTDPAGRVTLESTESLWRSIEFETVAVLSDESAAAPAESLLDFNLDPTTEVPVVPPRRDDRSRIGGDELQ